MENNIKIGDTVRLKGQPNGPVMTVTKEASQRHLVGTTEPFPQKTEFVCAWFDRHICLEKEFHPDALEKVEKPSLLFTKIRRGMTVPLLQESPIKPIRNDDDHAAALRRIEEIFDAEAGTPLGDELEVLTVLVEDYERREIESEDKPSPSEPDRKPTVGCGHEAPKAYTLADLEKCFNESRLTHPMAGFKHESFGEYMSWLETADLPHLGTENGYFHWYTTEEGGGVKPFGPSWRLWSRDEVLSKPYLGDSIHSIFLASEKTVPPKTWDEVWASITDIYDRKDGQWVRRPLPAEKKSEDEWHYITTLEELHKLDGKKVWVNEVNFMDWIRMEAREVALKWDKASSADPEHKKANRGYELRYDFRTPSCIRIKKSDLK